MISIVEDVCITYTLKVYKNILLSLLNVPYSQIRYGILSINRNVKLLFQLDGTRYKNSTMMYRIIIIIEHYNVVIYCSIILDPYYVLR